MFLLITVTLVSSISSMSPSKLRPYPRPRLTPSDVLRYCSDLATRPSYFKRCPSKGHITSAAPSAFVSNSACLGLISPCRSITSFRSASSPPVCALSWSCSAWKANTSASSMVYLPRASNLSNSCPRRSLWLGDARSCISGFTICAVSLCTRRSEVTIS
jgi:hypothetical protein